MHIVELRTYNLGVYALTGEKPVHLKAWEEDNSGNGVE